jgi:hypothetical protein
VKRNSNGEIDRAPIWAGLQRFARAHMGRRSTWNDLKDALQPEFDRPLDQFFDLWVHGHPVPLTPTTIQQQDMMAFASHYAPYLQVEMAKGAGDGGGWVEIDPEFRLYRVLPLTQIVPLIGGTRGPGGVHVISKSDRPEAKQFIANYDQGASGENLIIIGAAALTEHADLLARCEDPIVIGDGAFTIGGETYEGETHSVMHTMHHPDRPGRYITVFHSNGEPGWRKLRLIVHYRRDTTVVFDGDDVLARRTYEPSRRIDVD